MRRRRQNIAGFICLCLVMGISQGLVLCVGCDGHVALRPGLHVHDEHGAPANAPPLARPPSSDHEDDHHHCGRCVDMPVSMYAVDEGVPGDRTDLLAILDSLEARRTQAQADPLTLRPIQTFSRTPYFTPLYSIILVV